MALAGSIVTDGEGKISLPPALAGAASAARLVSFSGFDELGLPPAQGHFRARHFFDTRWRGPGDFHWVLALMKNQVPMQVFDHFTSVFADTGENMSLKPKRRLRKSRNRWHDAALGSNA